MSVGNRFEFVEIFFGAMRAGIVPVPLNTKLGAETLDYIMRDAECVARDRRGSGESACRPDRRGDGLQDRGCCSTGIGPGWPITRRRCRRHRPGFDPPRLPDDHPSFQPYTSGSTGRPKGRRAHPCRAVLVDPLPAEILAGAAGRPGAGRGAALPQERHGRRHQADAELGWLGCPAAEFRAAALPPDPVRIPLHPCRRRPGRLHAAAAGARSDRDPRFLGAQESFKIGSAPTPKELLDAVEAAFGVAASRELRPDRGRAGDDRHADRRSRAAPWQLRRRSGPRAR